MKMRPFQPITAVALSFIITCHCSALYAPCPILGKRYPWPKQLTKSPEIAEALHNLTVAFDQLNRNGSSDYTQATPNTTTYSLGLFDAGSDAFPSSPLIYENHHVAPSLREAAGSNISLDSTSIYNIGGLSQILTVYALLVSKGEDCLYHPVTNYLGNLNSSLSLSRINDTDWQAIRLIDLATQLSGIARDVTLDNVSGLAPPELAAILPTSNIDHTIPSDIQPDILTLLQKRRPIYQPATTPIYSDAAFEVLALVLEQMGQDSFTNVLSHTVLQPLNLTSFTVGTPDNVTNAVVLNKTLDDGWQSPNTSETAAFASQWMFSSISDLSVIGASILHSHLLSEATTNRWLKPHSYTSNLVNGVGAPFEIYTPTLTGDATGAVIPIFTKSGSTGLYSPYFGLVPDYGVGFVILSADTNRASDLNAYSDLIAEIMLPALEEAAARQAAVDFSGNYTSLDKEVRLTIDVDGLPGISILKWTANGSTIDVRASYAKLSDIAPNDVDFRLYPTNLKQDLRDSQESLMAFRGVLQDISAPVDAGTPTCETWQTSVDRFVYNGLALDEFVFRLDSNGSAVLLEIPALEMVLERTLAG